MAGRFLTLAIRKIAGVHPRAQSQQQVEHHAHAGQHFARERVADQVRIDHRIARRQLLAGQVMVGHDHADAAGLRRRHAGNAGHPVVDSDDQLRRGLQRGDKGRAEAVAVREAIRDGVAHPLRAEQAQAAHRHRSAGGAVAVVVAGDQDRPVVADRLGEQLDRLRHPAQQLRRQHPRQPVFDLARFQHAARGVDLLQHRMHRGRPAMRHALAFAPAQLQHAQRPAPRQKRQRWNGLWRQRSPLAKCSTTD